MNKMPMIEMSTNTQILIVALECICCQSLQVVLFHWSQMVLTEHLFIICLGRASITHAARRNNELHSLAY